MRFFIMVGGNTKVFETVKGVGPLTGEKEARQLGADTLLTQSIPGLEVYGDSYWVRDITGKLTQEEIEEFKEGPKAPDFNESRQRGRYRA